MIEPPLREIRRYLGMKGEDPQVESLIAECVRELNEVISPRSVYRYFDLSFEDGYPVIEGHVLKSRDLAKNLRGCRQVILLACTLGIGADRLLNRSSFSSMTKAAVIQAAAAAMIEEYTDTVCREIEADLQNSSLYLRPRFSCGYGDLGLDAQKVIFALLDPAKKRRHYTDGQPAHGAGEVCDCLYRHIP